MSGERRVVPTFCRVCEPACGLLATVQDGELVALAPDREHPVTKGFACHKGLAGVDIHRDPDRLDHPLRRAGAGRFERASWDEATLGIAGALRGIVERHGPEAVGAYVGNPAAFNALVGPAIGSFFGQLGARRMFGSGTQDCANKFAGSEAVFGSSTIHPIPDIARTDCLLVFGANPRVSHMSFVSIADPMRELRAATARGARVVYVNPRRVESVESGGGEWLPIRPDTDLYLLAALLEAIDRGPGFRREVVEAHGARAEALRAFVRRYPAERVAPVTGIPAETIRALARAFAEAPRASVHMSTGVNMGRQGTLAYWLLHMLSFVTGNLDRAGGNLLSVGFYPAAKAGRVDGRDPFFESRYGKLRRIRGSLPGNLLADEILAPEGERPIRALFVVAGNPLLSVGGEERLREAFGRLELLVCVDLYRNATGEFAHWLLPSTDSFERPDLNLTGLGLQYRPFVQYTEPVTAPRGERREEWWIFARLQQALGQKSVLDGADAAAPAALHPRLFGRLDHMLRYSGLSVEALRAQPHGAQLPEPEPGRLFRDGIQTADGKVDCCPPLFAEALERAEAIFRELEAEGAQRLKLVTRRDPWMHNSWYHNVPRFKRPGRRENLLSMHPEDAAARGLAEGQLALCRNAWGAVRVRVGLDAGLVRGVAALTHGWGHEGAPGMRVAAGSPGVNANRLLPTGPGSYEPLSNQAFMTGVPIEVEPAG